jgi:hypothetical protein
MMTVAVGSALSLAYPHFAGEAQAQVVVDASVIISAYYAAFKMLNGTAGGREALEYFVVRYWSFVAVSVGLVWRLVNHPAAEFSKHPAWAVTVTVIAAAVQTWYCAGDGIKAWHRGRTGIPELDDPRARNLSATDRGIVGDIATTLHAKKQNIECLGAVSRSQGTAISGTMNDHFGRYAAGLAQSGAAFERLLGQAGTVADQDGTVKLFIEIGAILQLFAPAILSAVQKRLFLSADSFAVGAAVSVQGAAKALDPAVNEAGMLEWFRHLVAVPIFQTIFLAIEQKQGLVQNGGPKWFGVWVGVLAFSAMSFGGLLGKGAGAAAGGLVSGARAVADRVHPRERDVEAMRARRTREELVTFLAGNLEIVRDIDAQLGDDVHTEHQALTRAVAPV